MSPIRRPAFVAAALVALLVVAACDTTSESVAPSVAEGPCPTRAAPDPASIPAWDPAAQQPSVFPQIINPAGTIACGPTRLMFSFLDADNLPVASPGRTVTVRLFDLAQNPDEPITTADATFIWAVEDEVGVYVAEVDLPAAGVWGAEFTTQLNDAAPESIRVQFDAQPESTVTAVGGEAPPSDTPTLTDVDGDVSLISSDAEPVEAFYETSIADAIAAKEPFVVAFATPKFCATQQCGPTLDRLKPIAARHPDVTVINVEPYQLESTETGLQPVTTGDPPQLTPAQATLDWRLPTEPWVFVVDRNGVVTDSFMLIFSDEELEAALAAVE